jgi:hypothetical protein
MSEVIRSRRFTRDECEQINEKAMQGMPNSKIMKLHSIDYCTLRDVLEKKGVAGTVIPKNRGVGKA